MNHSATSSNMKLTQARNEPTRSLLYSAQQQATDHGRLNQGLHNPICSITST